jgi:hypothetical protein
MTPYSLEPSLLRSIPPKRATTSLAASVDHTDARKIMVRTSNPETASQNVVTFHAL